MQANVIARQEGGMRWLGNNVSCVPDLFGVDGPIKREALIRWNLITHWVVAIYGDDEGS